MKSIILLKYEKRHLYGEQSNANVVVTKGVGMEGYQLDLIPIIVNSNGRAS